MSKPGILEGINDDHRRIAAGWLIDLSHLAKREAIPPHVFPGLLMWMAGYFVACQQRDDAAIMRFVKSTGWHFFRAGTIDGNATRGPDALTIIDEQPTPAGGAVAIRQRAESIANASRYRIGTARWRELVARAEAELRDAVIAALAAAVTATPRDKTPP